MTRTRAVIATVLGLGVAGAVTQSPGLRVALRAAARAFADPTLLDRSPAQLPPGSGACGPLADGAPSPEVHVLRDFDPVPADQTDPDGAALRSLVMPDLTVPITRRTLHFVRHFAKNERGRKLFLERYRRAGKYRGIVEGALREAGLPEDLLWLAGIESGFDPTATSPAGAAGLWQFMPETGMVYGLEQSAWHDERRSVQRSTAAAALHLRDLHERFGRWDLALAAYNAGFDTVLRAMEKVAKARASAPLPEHKPIEFADLAGAGLLPAETASYVPQIMAFAIVVANRARFSLDSADFAPAPALEPAELYVPQGTRLRTVARAAGLPLAVLRDYNPQVLRDRVPPVGGEYPLFLPSDRITRAQTTFAAYQQQETLAEVDDEPDDGLRPPRAVASSDPASLDAGEQVERLPSRPRHLGKNRLPTFEVPGRSAAAAMSQDVVAASLSPAQAVPSKLPGGALSVGWKTPFVSSDDPFGLLRASRADSRYRDLALEKATAFLGEAAPLAPVGSFVLASGVEVRVQRAKSPDVQIAVRLMTGNAEPSRWLTAELGKARAESELVAHQAGSGDDASARFGAGESVHVAHVAAGDLEVGLAVAAGRARVLLAQGSDASVGALRGVLTAARRRTLEETSLGRAQVALFDALYPAGHVLAGTVPGRSEDPVLARDLALVDAMVEERAPRRVTITVRGDVAEARVRAAIEGNLPVAPALFGARGLGVGLHPKEERIRADSLSGVGSGVGARGDGERVLVGWSVPRLGLRDRASLLYALEILGGPKGSRLGRALVLGEDCPTPAPCEKAALGAAAHLETGSLGSTAWLELQAAPAHTVDDLAKQSDDVLRVLETEGPTQREMSVAHFWLKQHIERELGRGDPKRGDPRTLRGTLELHLRELFSPKEFDDLLAELPKVQLRDVQKAVRRLLARDHRVVLLVSRPDAHGAAVAFAASAPALVGGGTR